MSWAGETPGQLSLPPLLHMAGAGLSGPPRGCQSLSFSTCSSRRVSASLVASSACLPALLCHSLSGSHGVQSCLCVRLSSKAPSVCVAPLLPASSQASSLLALSLAVSAFICLSSSSLSCSQKNLLSGEMDGPLGGD